MTSADEFVAGTAGLARWPTPPGRWSYSSLSDAEACPRRWSLSHASYPDVWERPGYPPRVGIAALVGDIIHGALEDLLRAVAGPATETEPGASAVAALRQLGGFTALIERGIERQVSKLLANPRMAPRADYLRAQLNRRAPEMRQRVQEVTARLGLGTVGARAEPDAPRGPLHLGLHPEVDLHASALRFKGRVDLVAVETGGVTITDYKTGEADPGHREQVRVYALLWQRDEKVNPSSTTATTLAIAYPSHDDVFDAPDQKELDELAGALRTRIAAVDAALALRPPAARPSPDTCRYCSVRHLCDDYWLDLPRHEPRGRTDRSVFKDYEGTIGQCNGPRSWLLRLDGTPGQVLLRTPTEEPGFDSGDRVRLLDVAVGADEDTEQGVATITQASEVFVVADN